MGPRLLLLDEPLASLDATRKREIVPYLEKLRDEARVPMVCVTTMPPSLPVSPLPWSGWTPGGWRPSAGPSFWTLPISTPWSELRPSLEQGPRFVSCLFQLADNG